MATQTDIPPDLTSDGRTSLFQSLDVNLNSVILYALLHGIYTGILVTTLWNISSKLKWSLMRSAFIDNGQSFWTVFSTLESAQAAYYWETGITASMSTILADLYVIWCCWMVWGQRWLVVLLPIFSLVSVIVSRITGIYYEYANALALMDIFLMLYLSFNLATTLSCNLFIIYRILTIAGVRRGAEGQLRVYHRFIEVLVESSALYSLSLILYLAFTIRGIAPTLLVGRITVGRRARQDDSWQGSVMASVSIRSQSQEHSQTSSQEDIPMSLVPNGDLEAQRESDVREPSPTFFAGPDVPEASEHVHSITGQHGDLS
ncbi:uncharacterized protein EV420DRAFT_1481753 [Desarmillaria tabescens]|uniref:Uncharacterized protein n=1 Tax=Armillaria tabescens TaxID=1929756 RepID=A0AA39K631_ARMTA|nr:uncharacterized protein EV420DRAFT_1481753 [Desarmillaria tabescens]KAK0454031.1 hypothetical protein EV420DRAFT_1481753 [Desarmillaria tabescens]